MTKSWRPVEINVKFRVKNNPEQLNFIENTLDSISKLRLYLPTETSFTRQIAERDNVPINGPFVINFFNIPYDAYTDDLKNFFKGCEITQIIRNCNRKGSGCIEFEDYRSLHVGLTYDDTKFQYRSIRLRVGSAKDIEKITKGNYVSHIYKKPCTSGEGSDDNGASSRATNANGAACAAISNSATSEHSVVSTSGAASARTANSDSAASERSAVSTRGAASARYVYSDSTASDVSARGAASARATNSRCVGSERGAASARAAYSDSTASEISVVSARGAASARAAYSYNAASAGTYATNSRVGNERGAASARAVYSDNTGSTYDTNSHCVGSERGAASASTHATNSHCVRSERGAANARGAAGSEQAPAPWFQWRDKKAFRPQYQYTRNDELDMYAYERHGSTFGNTYNGNMWNNSARGHQRTMRSDNYWAQHGENIPTNNSRRKQNFHHPKLISKATFKPPNPNATQRKKPTASNYKNNNSGR